MCGYYHYTEEEIEAAHEAAEHDLHKGARAATRAGMTLK